MKQEVICQMMSQLAVRNAIMFLNAAELYGAGESVQKEFMEFCKNWICYFLYKIYMQHKLKIHLPHCLTLGLFTKFQEPLAASEGATAT